MKNVWHLQIQDGSLRCKVKIKPYSTLVVTWKDFQDAGGKVGPPPMVRGLPSECCRRCFDKSVREF